MFNTGLQGVSFQPGQGGYGAGNGNGQSQSASDGVQEAIKILSLRLPRVVGARGIAPQALLESMGSSANPNIDSVVNRVWQKFFPVSVPASPLDLGLSGGGPDFTGSLGETSPPRYTAPMRMPSSVDRVGQYPQFPSPPRIIPGDTPQDDRNGPTFPPPAPSPTPVPSPVPDPMSWSPYEI